MARDRNTWNYSGTSLFTHAGERKYLNMVERKAFLAAIPSLHDPMAESFCELIFWTGCRPSEALVLTRQQIDLDDKLIVFRSLKKRTRVEQFRPIPVPSEFLRRFAEVHGLDADTDPTRPLWPFARTTAWKHMTRVMTTAGITGDRACARGLRHSLGVQAALCDVPLTRIQRWLGHASLEITAIYLDVAGPEDRSLARRLWATA